MKDDFKGSSTSLPALRRRAEDLLAGRAVNVQDLTKEEMRYLVYELQVHQIELEMQNEELHKAHDELIEARDKYTDLYDFAPVGYFSLDQKGRILEANLKAVTMLDVDRSFLLGKTLNRFIETHDKDIFYKHTKNLIKTADPQRCELRMIKKDGAKFYVLMESAAMTDVIGKITRYRTVISDITDRKLMEVELQAARDQLEQRVAERTVELKLTYDQLLHAEKLSAIGKLSASIAHEFNNPLYGIQSVIEGIKRNTGLDKNDRQLVDLALSECRRVKNLIRSLQEFNRPSSGKKELLDVHHLLDDMLLMVKKDFKDARVTIHKQYGADLPKVMAVADQLKQVFLNLLTNAKDAITSSTGTIIIKTERLDEKLAIHVQDSGDGITSENLPHIFEPFFSTKPAVKGTGLGLPISYGIIKGHGGDIKVESKPGNGTTFTVLLPLPGKSNG